MRKEGWEVRFLGALQRHLDLPFEYGVSDCVRMALDVHEAITGDRLLGDVTWSDEVSAMKELKSRGGLYAAVSNELDEKSPALAQRGDFGIYENDGIESLVICDGLSWVGKTKDGRQYIDRFAVKAAFKVG